MKKPISILAVAVLASPAVLPAQLAAPNEVGVSMGHVHLVVPDLEAAKAFWVALGGEPGKLGPNEVFKFPGALILLRQGEPSGASVGSVVNHIAFTVPNVKASMEKWKAAGLKTLPLTVPDQGFLFTPGDLVRVEALENSSLSVPITFDHVHFNVVDPAADGSSSIAAMQAWYAKVFGAKPGMRKQFKAGDLPGVNLTFAKANNVQAVAGTKGRAIDHIGFEIKNLEAFCKKAETNGVKFDIPFRTRPELGVSMAFMTDPWGVYIELTEGLDKQ